MKKAASTVRFYHLSSREMQASYVSSVLKTIVDYNTENTLYSEYSFLLCFL